MREGVRPFLIYAREGVSHKEGDGRECVIAHLPERGDLGGDRHSGS